MIKKIHLIIIFCCLFSGIVFNYKSSAQVNCIFKGEGNNDLVKLMWLIDYWPENLVGFDIKRRSIENGAPGNWITINSTVIFPEISMEKNLSNVEKNKAEVLRLQEKLEDMIEKGKTKEIKNEDYIKMLKSGPDVIQSFVLPFALDYEFAIINGFGLVDREIPPGEKYQYGVFLVYTDHSEDPPISTFDWEYGSLVQKETNIDLFFRTTKANDQIQILWKFDPDTLNALGYAGFNIYRKTVNKKYIKLNNTPLWFNIEQKQGKFSFFDENIKENTIYHYAISPVTIFNTEGEKNEQVFDPVQYAHINAPYLKTNKLEDGIELTWVFNKEQERQIRYFFIEKREVNDPEYIRVSKEISRDERSYRLNPPNDKIINYRLGIAKNDLLNIYSEEVMLYLLSEKKPPEVKNLKAGYLKEDNSQYILLNWDAKNVDDTLTKGYYLYSNFPPDTNLSREGSIPLITDNSYKYKVYNSFASKYRFAVIPVSKNNSMGDTGKIVEVVSPSQFIPDVRIWPFSVDSNIVKLNWKYNENIADLKGFRIFQNNKIVATEDILSKGSRQWVSPPLIYNAKYVFEIMAVTEFGIESEKSAGIRIVTEKKQINNE